MTAPSHRAAATAAAVWTPWCRTGGAPLPPRGDTNNGTVARGIQQRPQLRHNPTAARVLCSQLRSTAPFDPRVLSICAAPLELPTRLRAFSARVRAAAPSCNCSGAYTTLLPYQPMQRDLLRQWHGACSSALQLNSPCTASVRHSAAVATVTSLINQHADLATERAATRLPNAHHPISAHTTTQCAGRAEKSRTKGVDALKAWRAAPDTWRRRAAVRNGQRAHAGGGGRDNARLARRCPPGVPLGGVERASYLAATRRGAVKEGGERGRASGEGK